MTGSSKASLSPIDVYTPSFSNGNSSTKQSKRQQHAEGGGGQRLSVYLPLGEDSSAAPFHPRVHDSPGSASCVPKSPSLIHPIYADPATLPPGFVMPLPSPDVEHGQSEQDLLWAAQSTQLPGSSPLDDKKRSSFDSIRSNSGVPPNINVDAANTHFSSSTGQPSGGIPVRQRSASPTYTTHPQHQSMTQPMTVSPSGSSNGMSNTNRPLPPLLVAFGRLPPGVQQLLDGPMAWLSYYFVLNLGLTLYNKFVLVKFPYPWALTGVHSLCGALGSYFLLQQGFFVQARLSRREIMILILFSMLYTINIAVSNLSLNLVTVPFHQVVRATTPIFTILINVGFMNKKTPLRVYLSLIPVVVGVGAATYGEYAFTLWGFFLTVLGAVLAAVKGIATNVLLVGRLKLHPLDLLLRMSPLAFAQCVLYSYFTGELEKVREYGAVEMTRGRAFALFMNGVFAFALNVVSFSANKKTSALTMTVAANVKQVLTILWAVWLFNVILTPMNTFGIAVTLFGGGYYAYVDHQIKKERRERERIAANTSPLMDVSEKR